MTIMLLLVLASCVGDGQNPQPTSPAAPTSQDVYASPAQSAPLPSPTLGTVIWTTDLDPSTGAPADEVSQYAPDAPRLIAALPATALPAGAMVNAAWFYNDTSLDAFNTTLTLPDRAAKRWVDFRLSREDDVPWPAGVYEVVITLDGAEVQRASVLVVDGA